MAITKISVSATKEGEETCRRTSEIQNNTEGGPPEEEDSFASVGLSKRKALSISTEHPLLNERLRTHFQVAADAPFDRCFDKAFDKSPSFDKGFDKEGPCPKR